VVRLRRRAAALAAAAAICACAAARRVEVRAAREGVVFRYRGEADAVVLRGSMTGWAPVALVRDGGAFALWLPLAPGRYEYRLDVRRGDAATAVLPDGAERVDDGFGGENGVVRVP
jgi:hypothetical protein